MTRLTVAEGLFGALSVIPPLAPLAPLLDLTSNFDRKQETKSFAVFAHTTLSVTERLRLTLASRFTREDKDYTLTGFKRESQTPILAPGPTNPSSCTDVTLRGIQSHFNCDQDWKEFSPKAGLDYQWTDDLMTYVHVSQGFRSGRFNGRPTFTNEVSEADPETLTSYEVGFKSQWLQDRLRVNGAGFINKYKDQQVLVTQATPLGLAILTDNAARSTMQGFELEITALPLPELTLTGAMSYVDAEFDSYETLINGVRTDVSDRPFADTPEWNASFTAQYVMPLWDLGSLKFLGNVAYQSDVHYTNVKTQSSFDVLNPGGFTLFNAALTYTTSDNRWEFALQGRNLTDKRTIKGGFGVDAFGHVEGLYTQPRRVFFSVKYSR